MKRILKELRSLAIVVAGIGVVAIVAVNVFAYFGMGGGYVMQQIYRRTHTFLPLQVGVVYAQTTEATTNLPLRVGEPMYDPTTGRLLGHLRSFTVQSGPAGWMPCDREGHRVPLTVEGIRETTHCANGGPLTNCPYATGYLCKNGVQIEGPLEDSTFRNPETGRQVTPD